MRPSLIIDVSCLYLSYKRLCLPLSSPLLLSVETGGCRDIPWEHGCQHVFWDRTKIRRVIIRRLYLIEQGSRERDRIVLTISPSLGHSHVPLILPLSGLFCSTIKTRNGVKSISWITRALSEPRRWENSWKSYLSSFRCPRSLVKVRMNCPCLTARSLLDLVAFLLFLCWAGMRLYSVLWPCTRVHLWITCLKKAFFGSFICISQGYPLRTKTKIS